MVCQAPEFYESRPLDSRQAYQRSKVRMRRLDQKYGWPRATKETAAFHRIDFGEVSVGEGGKFGSWPLQVMKEGNCRERGLRPWISS